MSGSRHGKVDERALRTRNRIARAVIRLGQERGVDRLTIRALAGEAGISRSTFYAHFGSLEDYLSRSFANMLEQRASHAARQAGDHRLLHVELILDHVASARGYVGAISRSRYRPRMMLAGEERLRRYLETRIAELRPRLAHRERADLARFVAGGFIAMLREWMESGMTQPPAEFRRRWDALIDRL